MVAAAIGLPNALPSIPDMTAAVQGFYTCTTIKHTELLNPFEINFAHFSKPFHQHYPKI
jgi:hypothetical protein